MIARLKLVKPCNENRQVGTAEVVSIAPVYDDRTLIGARFMPARQPNADLRSPEYLTPAEIEKLIKAAKDGRWGQRDACLIIVAYRHGLRAKEACELEWSQVEFGRSASLEFFPSPESRNDAQVSFLVFDAHLRGLPPINA
jgi:integrase